MSSLQPPTFADFTFNTIGRPPSLLQRMSMSDIPVAVDNDDTNMDDASPVTCPVALPDVAQPPPPQRPRDFLQVLRETVAAAQQPPRVASPTRGSDPVAPSSGSLLTRLISMTSSGHAARTNTLSSLLNPSPDSPSSDRGTRAAEPSSSQPVANATSLTSTPVNQSASSFSVSSTSRLHPTFSPLPTPSHADTATELYARLTALATEKAQWDELRLFARRFREENEEYLRRHDETTRAREREKEQAEKVIHAAEAALDQVELLRKRQEQRWEEDRTRAERVARTAERMPMPAPQPVSGLPKETQQSVSVPAAPAASLPVRDVTATAQPAQFLNPIELPATLSVHVSDSGMACDGEEASAQQPEIPRDQDLEAAEACNQQELAERTERELNEARAQGQRERQEVETRRQQAAEEEARAKRELEEQARRERELEEARMKKEAEKDAARKQQELAEQEKRDEVAALRKCEAEKAEALKQRELEEAEASKKEMAAAEAHRQQELEAQRQRDLELAAVQQSEWRAKREEFQAKKRRDEERAAFLKQQELKEKLEREKAASETSSKEASRSPSASAHDASSASKKAVPVASTHSERVKEDDGTDKTSNPFIDIPVTVTVTAASASSMSHGPAKIASNRSMKQEAPETAVKFEESPSPEISKAPSVTAAQTKGGSDAPPFVRTGPVSETPANTIQPQANITHTESPQRHNHPLPQLPPKPQVPIPPPNFKRPVAARPQEQTILGYNVRERDRSGRSQISATGVGHEYPTGSISPVMPAMQDPSQTEARSNIQPVPAVRSSLLTANYPTMAVGDDNGMINDPRIGHPDNGHGFRSPTPEEMRHLRLQSDHYPPPSSGHVGRPSGGRYDDHWSVRESYSERILPGHKRPREEDPALSYPPPRRLRGSHSNSSQGSPGRRHVPAPRVDVDRTRSPPRLAASMVQYAAPTSPRTPPRQLYRSRSPPEWRPNPAYTRDESMWMPTSPALSSLPDLAWPTSAELPESRLQWEDFSDLRGRPRTSPPPIVPASSVPSRKREERHDLLSRIEAHEPRQKRRSAATGINRKPSNSSSNSSKPPSAQPTKRGKAVSRNNATTASPRTARQLIDRLDLQSRISG